MKRTLRRYLIGGTALLGATVGGAGSAGLQATDAKPCEKNACQISVGNCDLVKHRYNCTETTTSVGCSDTECD
jgi:hypothetical protein